MRCPNDGKRMAYDARWPGPMYYCEYCGAVILVDPPSAAKPIGDRGSFGGPGVVK